MISICSYEPVESHSESEDSPDFKIDKIVATRVNTKGQTEYYVEWAGYDPDENSWVDHDELSDYIRLMYGSSKSVVDFILDSDLEKSEYV